MPVGLECGCCPGRSQRIQIHVRGGYTCALLILERAQEKQHAGIQKYMLYPAMAARRMPGTLKMEGAASN